MSLQNDEAIARSLQYQEQDAASERRATAKRRAAAASPRCFWDSASNRRSI